MQTINSINIVAIGNWNKRIFTPNWVSQFLFKSENTLEGLINQDEVELGYKCDGITIFPKDSVLEIGIEKLDLCSKAIEILNQILKELPHTPIKAIGFNIRYEFGKDCVLYKFIEKTPSFSEEFNFSSIKYFKPYSKYIFNIEIGSKMPKEDIGVVNFNYHYQNPAASVSFDKSLFESLYTESQKCMTDGKL